ncbi:class I SAM-dependent methyltransferase [Paenibacillus jiagnxiensis]|uniref:class I SAM-dependent methyltransferase n=1 Tax=Paenibacillus jiagnxiensis TaxID=3228926 RepID=UPI0033B64AD4
MLEKLGVIGAHPGGLEKTRKLIETMNIPAGSKILEVGCGAGETACFLASAGFEVSALDNRPRFLQLAEERAYMRDVTVNWVEADIENMPFPPDSFDAVLAESVTLFTSIQTAFDEYFRVLKPGGVLADCEIVLKHDMQQATAQQITEFMDLDGLYKVDEWIQFMENSGFVVKQPVERTELWDPDQFAEGQKVDTSLFLDSAVSQAAAMYFELMISNFHYFQNGMFIGKKFDAKRKFN